MKATGICRRIDDLGRVVIPKEIRNSMGIREGDALEIFVDDDKICFKKYCPQKEEAEEIRKYVDKNRSYVLLTISEGEATKVVFKDGQVVTVKRNKTDDFDLNKAVYAAMIKKGFEGI